MKKQAFTLAETMIAAIIIGIIAFIVLPNIYQSFQKRMFVSKLQRWYADMSNTIDEFIIYNDNKMEDIATSLSSNTFKNSAFINFLDEKYGDLYPKNASITNNLTTSLGLIRMSGTPLVYKWLNSNSGFNLDTAAASKFYKTKYGVLFGVGYQVPNHGKYWNFYVDVNGSKGPNIKGRDLHFFYYVLQTTQYS